jgi:hypothetical protein
VPHPITILRRLNEITLELNMEQSWVDHARASAPTNQVVQLSLDRKQAEIDTRREMVQLALYTVSSRN